MSGAADAGEFRQWLLRIGLGQYAGAFAENGIGWDILPDLSEADLKELGLSLGDRKRLLKAMANLAAELPTQRQGSPQDADSAEGERRQVTVLFADLAGFTQLSERQDPEDTHALLNRFFAVVDGIIQSYGGHIDKHIGDAVMAVFGAPVAHHNDPERAIRAALDIHHAVKALDPALSVHIGIASGPVVAGNTGSDTHGHYTVTGPTVNLAARLQDLARADETLIADAVRRALGPHLRAEPLDDVSIKGLEQPVLVWRVHALVDGARSWLGPFVGRQRELRKFAGLLAACSETGAGQTLYVRGEGGIGKTRLIEEFIALARNEGFASHTALVLDFGIGAGQDAIRTLVRSLLGLDPSSSENERAAAAAQAVTTGLVSADCQIFLTDLLELPQPPALNVRYDAMDTPTRVQGREAVLTELLRQASRQQPRLLIVEDIHWASSEVLVHLAAVAASLADCPALLVMTSRVEEDPINDAWRARARGGPLAMLDLAPLRKEDALALAGAYLQESHHTIMSCVKRAEGNPLFLEQLLQGATEIADNSLPGSLHSLVLARMDLLPPKDRAALQAAAVVGQRFSLGLVRQLLSDCDYTCAGLVARQLIRPLGGDEYLFAHALVRDGVYASLMRARRTAMHARAAEWFAGRDHVLHAEHLDRAGRPEAAQGYFTAACAEAAVYRHERALQLVERGLEVTRGGEAFELTWLRGELLRELGALEESITAFEAALKLAVKDDERCRAWLGMALGLRLAERFRDALPILDEAERAATSAGLALERAHIHSLRGNLHFSLGRSDDCRKAHELALQLARTCGSAEAEARALGGLGDADYMRGRMRTAFVQWERCLEICRAHGLRRIEVPNLCAAGYARQYLLQYRESLEDGEAAAAMAAEIGDQRSEVLARALVGHALYHLGQMQAAERVGLQVIEMGRRLDRKNMELTAVSIVGLVWILTGRKHEAEGLLREALSSGGMAGLIFTGPFLLSLLAYARDDPQKQDEALAEGERLLSASPISHNHFHYYRFAAETMLNRGDWGRADSYAAALEAFARAEPLPWSEHTVARVRALAAYGRGRRDHQLFEELRQLRDQADSMGLVLLQSPVEDALLGFCSYTNGH